MADVVSLLKKERDVLSKRLHALESAISALSEDVAKEARSVRKDVRKMSAATRAKLSKAAKERWARVRAKVK